MYSLRGSTNWAPVSRAVAGMSASLPDDDKVTQRFQTPISSLKYKYKLEL